MIFKCKMCGGALEIQNNETIVECEYCGSKQTLPKLDDDRRANMYDRANHFRRNNEFDKAMGIYEQILNEDSTDAESYWSLVLCRYGIEYVEDPTTHKRVPTVNRAQFTSIFDDDNYKSALANADTYQKAIYEQEAKAINEIQKGILAISQKEEPFDVFICYKETDNNGRRTPDSVLANDLYHQLTQEGFKVFFSRITLEDKLGTAYEPYIFAALNSAKVMVVLGTKPEYFNAVWVKNEWSRYLALIKQGQKKVLIPAYKDMDPYDLPEEFSHLQAQDMSKLGFMQDLIRGIKKIAQVDEPKPTVVKETVISGGNANTVPLLKRAFMFLEDGEWDSANEYCEKVLDIDPENAQAYLGKLMAELKVGKPEDLKHKANPFSNNNNYQKALRFADSRLKNELSGYIDFITNRNLTNAYNAALSDMKSATTEELYKKAAAAFKKISGFKDSEALAKECMEKAEEARLTKLFDEAISAMNFAKTEWEYKETAEQFKEIANFKNADEYVKICLEKAENARKDEIFGIAKAKMTGNTIDLYKTAIGLFESVSGWKDADEQIEICKKAIEKIEADRIEIERQAEIARKKRKKKALITTIMVVVICIAYIITIKVIIPEQNYNSAVALMETGNVVEAYEALAKLDGYKDSAEKADSIYDKYEIEKLKTAQVGDYVFFGKYEQDNNTTNGKENIKWLVLDKQEDKLLVISKYALDCKWYNTSRTAVTWETCSLRKWLNDDFINTAFTEVEQSMIPTVTVSADKNPEYSTDPGNATQDKVFLLSISEANKYFSSDSTRQCKPTDYAVAKGAYVNSSNGNCWWWLRSPGKDQNYAAYVYCDGDIDEYGGSVHRGNRAVRPALWIDLNS